MAIGKGNLFHGRASCRIIFRYARGVFYQNGMFLVLDYILMIY